MFHLAAFREHVKRVVEAEKRSKPDYLILLEPPAPAHYHWHYLHLANLLFEASGVYVLNPRNIGAASLFDADGEWLEDFQRYRQYLQFERDKDRRPPEMR